jgi:hypothetical protein
MKYSAKTKVVLCPRKIEVEFIKLRSQLWGRVGHCGRPAVSVAMAVVERKLAAVHCAWPGFGRHWYLHKGPAGPPNGARIARLVAHRLATGLATDEISLDPLPKPDR